MEISLKYRVVNKVFERCGRSIKMHNHDFLVTYDSLIFSGIVFHRAPVINVGLLFVWPGTSIA